MRLFDSHCHLEDEKFAEDQSEVLQHMKEYGVDRCILGGSTFDSCKQIALLCAAYPGFIYGTAGIHPHEADSWDECSPAKLEDLLNHSGMVGIGEIGLDYYYDLSPRDTQKNVLENQLDLACQRHLPAAFHVRDAHGDFYDILRARSGRIPEGVLHCFSGSVEMARQYLNMGLYISFAGPVTFKNAANLQEAARYVPLDRILIETDSPYLAPVPLRGKRNEPANVRYVAEVIANLKGLSAENLAEQTYQNACTLYRIPFSEESSYVDSQNDC